MLTQIIEHSSVGEKDKRYLYQLRHLIGKSYVGT
jgi:hypothetical protein